ncbi:hypothetical protein LSH36_213g03041 [Paralvinella palmiformis]|uniref:Uncharacterized protein n=1 Tax=Paralvinella palmiformis TaxID=53620 RepID=A0AAD9N6Z6_9ANNE|nr:hypothetical protein LSH36_213g03041 [Paralvinella palmiformis]
MARQAMILDLKAGTVVRLGQSRIAAVIGLSKKEELLCATGDELEKPDMVLELCRIKYKADGHWLIPKPNLPTTVNDNLIKGHILLNNGKNVD